MLAFQGGILNVGGYLSVHRFVSHITGFATLFGAEWVANDLLRAFGMLLVPLVFLFGVCVSAFFIERRRLLNKRPQYTLVFGFMIINLFIIYLGGINGFLGSFGEDFNYRRDYVLLFLLAYTCGLQNATIASASGSVIRTTHLTGLVTDLGIGLVRLWTKPDLKAGKEYFINYCRFGIIASFVAGSLFGAILFNRFEFHGFAVPVVISLYIAHRLRAKARAVSAL